MGFDINQPLYFDTKSTPLHEAAKRTADFLQIFSGNIDWIKWLLENSANPTVIDSSGVINAPVL